MQDEQGAEAGANHISTKKCSKHSLAELNHRTLVFKLLIFRHAH